jgi:hypothetical protein
VYIAYSNQMDVSTDETPMVHIGPELVIKRTLRWFVVYVERTGVLLVGGRSGMPRLKPEGRLVPGRWSQSQCAVYAGRFTRNLPDLVFCFEILLENGGPQPRGDGAANREIETRLLAGMFSSSFQVVKPSPPSTGRRPIYCQGCETHKS